MRCDGNAGERVPSKMHAQRNSKQALVTGCLLLCLFTGDGGLGGMLYDSITAAGVFLQKMRVSFLEGTHKLRGVACGFLLKRPHRNTHVKAIPNYPHVSVIKIKVIGSIWFNQGDPTAKKFLEHSENLSFGVSKCL